MPNLKCVFYSFTQFSAPNQWRTEGGWGVQPPEISQSRTGLQTERKMFSVPIPTS